MATDSEFDTRVPFKDAGTTKEPALPPPSRRPLPPTPPQSDRSDGSSEEQRQNLAVVKTGLADWRPILAPILPVLQWRQNWHPVLLFTTNTLLFVCLWFLRLSAISIACLLAAFITLGDLLLPIASKSLFGHKKWTESQDADFEKFCVKLLEARTHVTDFVDGLKRSRSALPQFFTTGMCIILLFAAIFFNAVGDFAFTYLSTTVALLAPGFYAHNGHIKAQQYSQRWLAKMHNTKATPQSSESGRSPSAPPPPVRTETQK